MSAYRRIVTMGGAGPSVLEEAGAGTRFACHSVDLLRARRTFYALLYVIQEGTCARS
jgi:hypothetical protein